jgi:hypothetical protein
MDWDGMSNLNRGPSIDASYQVSVHLAEGFQRRLKCEKLTDDGRQVMAKAHFALARRAKQKLLNLNCASIIGRSFTNFVFFMLIVIPR